MVTTHLATIANKEIVRRFLLAIPAKDCETLRSVLAPEAHFSLMIAGVYSPELRAFPEGTQWDREGLIQMEMHFQRRLEGPFSLEILSLIAEGDSVAVEAIGRARRATTSRLYVQHYSYHFRISNGLITDVRLYQDTFHHWEVWSDSESSTQPDYLTAGRLAGVPKEQATSAVGDRIAVNKLCVQRFLTGVRNRNPEVARAVWSAEGVWSFAVGGDYSPKLRAFEGAPRWDREGMISMQQSAQDDLREPLTLDIYSLIAEGDEISAEAIGILVRANGRAYRQHYSLHFKARDGRLVEGHVYQDTLHLYDVSQNPPLSAPVAART